MKMEEFYFKEKQTTLISDFLKIIKEKMPEKEIKFQQNDDKDVLGIALCSKENIYPIILSFSYATGQTSIMIHSYKKIEDDELSFYKAINKLNQDFMISNVSFFEENGIVVLKVIDDYDGNVAALFFSIQEALEIVDEELF